MSAQLQIFEHQQFGSIRMIQDENTGEPWFVAKDVASVLGYSNAPQTVADHCKHAKILKSIDSICSNIPARGLTIIPESDMYRLIIRSKLPAAEKFEAWVMEEVLPAIRKSGGYVTASPEDSPEIIMARALFVAKDAIDRLKGELAEAAPKAALVDAAFAGQDRQPMRLTEVARKLDGVNTMTLKRDLCEALVFYRAAGQYRVYARYRDSHFVEKFNPYSGKQDIYATDKGAALIARLFRDGVLTMKAGYKETH